MLYSVKDSVDRIFNTKDREDDNLSVLKRKVSSVYDSSNPFVKKDGSLVNPFINYQNLLDSSQTSGRVKKLVSQATGLTAPTSLHPQKIQTKTAVYNDSPIVSKSSIVDSAKKFLGTPYVWGGESMAEGGMDCSGFVYNALKNAGYDIGRTTAEGYRDYGTKINRSDLQEGDLIFFGTGDKATHIGIYIGNGQMIHSSGGSKNTKDNPGKGVSIAKVDYRSDFLEARRY